MKEIEPYFKSMMVEKSDEITNTALFTSSTEKLAKSSSSLAEYLVNLGYSSLSLQDMYSLSQLTKLNAYGITDLNLIFPPFKALITARSTVDKTISREIRNMFVMKYLEGYRAKHRFYPKLKMSTKVNERLVGVISSNQAIFSNQSYYDFMNYKGFTLLQTETLDLDAPLLDHVIDRALSCPMKSLPSMYDRLAYNMKFNRNLPYTERAETKLINKYIADESYDPVEIVRKYKAREYVNTLDMVTACIKAVEVKDIEKGRFFTKESLEKRFVSTLCEKLIKGPILSLFNTQAMTLEQVDTTKLIYNMSQCTDRDRFLMLDISKFCSSIEGE